MAKRSTKRAATAKPHVEKQQETTPTNGKTLGGITGKGFMPGKSGNPLGRRPLAVTLSQHVRDIGSEVIDTATGWTRLDAVLRRLYNDAMSGKVPAADILLERGWGKVMQPIEVSWQEEARRLIADGKLTPEGVWAETSKLVSELFPEIQVAEIKTDMNTDA